MFDNKTALVATPAARDRTIQRLQDHYARNYLDVAEYERRVELAERATSDAALSALESDLPATEVDGAAAPAESGRARVNATLGATSRRGRWRVPALVTVRAVLGSVDIDLFEAELGRGETLVRVSALLGSVVVTVPEGLAVICEGRAVLGSFHHLVQGPASRRDARRVRIVGSAKLGTVDVRVRKKTGVLEDIKRTVRGLLSG